MPPIVTGSDDSWSESEIPAKAPKKPTVEEVTDEDDKTADEDEEEVEYEAEVIQDHQVGKGNKIFYMVKWKGWSEEDNTWEPEDGLMEGASELVTDYLEQIGGRNALYKKKKKDKRKPNDESKRAPKRAKKSKAESEDSPAPAPAKEAKAWAPPKGSWESAIVAVEHVEEELDVATGKREIYAFVRWSNAHLTKHQLSVMKTKAPVKMCDFYETHLVFKSGSQGRTSNSASDGAVRLEDESGAED